MHGCIKRRAVMAALGGLIAVSMARADQPVLVPIPNSAVTGSATANAEAAPRTRRLPFLCWSNHNGYSCSGLRSEYTFLFGSCRAFFGEPCLKCAPPPAFPGDNSLPGCKRCRQ